MPFQVEFRGVPSDGSKQPRRIPRYQITPIGEAKLKDLDESDHKFQVLWACKARGPSTVKEISEESHLSPPKVEYLVVDKVDGLLPSGCLMESRGGSS